MTGSVLGVKIAKRTNKASYYKLRRILKDSDTHLMALRLLWKIHESSELRFDGKIFI